MQNKKTKNKDLHLGSNLYNFRIGIKFKQQWCIAILTHCDLFDMTSFHVKSCMLRNDATSVSVSKLSKMATTLCFFLPNKRTRLENDLFFQKRGWNSFTLIASVERKDDIAFAEHKSSDVFFFFFHLSKLKIMRSLVDSSHSLNLLFDNCHHLKKSYGPSLLNVWFVYMVGWFEYNELTYRVQQKTDG